LKHRVFNTSSYGNVSHRQTFLSSRHETQKIVRKKRVWNIDQSFVKRFPKRKRQVTVHIWRKLQLCEVVQTNFQSRRDLICVNRQRCSLCRQTLSSASQPNCTTDEYLRSGRLKFFRGSSCIVTITIEKTIHFFIEKEQKINI